MQISQIVITQKSENHGKVRDRKIRVIRVIRGKTFFRDFRDFRVR